MAHQRQMKRTHDVIEGSSADEDVCLSDDFAPVDVEAEAIEEYESGDSACSEEAEPSEDAGDACSSASGSDGDPREQFPYDYVVFVELDGALDALFGVRNVYDRSAVLLQDADPRVNLLVGTAGPAMLAANQAADPFISELPASCCHALALADLAGHASTHHMAVYVARSL
jgi:hypothetical protein